MSAPTNHEEGSPSRLRCPSCDMDIGRPCEIRGIAWCYCEARIQALREMLGRDPFVRTPKPDRDAVTFTMRLHSEPRWWLVLADQNNHDPGDEDRS